MKVVLDTNVLVSGIFFGGVPARVLSAWSVGEVDLVLSPTILDEYRRVGADLAIRHAERAAMLEQVLTLLAMNATIVDAPPLIERVSGDPADDMFLAAALATRTRLIVSGEGSPYSRRGSLSISMSPLTANKRLKQTPHTLCGWRRRAARAGALLQCGAA